MAVQRVVRSRRSALLIGVGFIALPASLQAQVAPPPVSDPQAANEENAREQPVGEIVVSANRREERLKDVPIAIGVVSGDTLEKSNIRAARELQYLVPSLSFSGTSEVSGGAGYQIRGVGTQAFNYGTEQTVGLMVDGVVIGLPRDPGATGFADIDRVEVLRGPQGTLFGKNSSAGLIQILTKKPVIGVSSYDAHLAFGSRDEVANSATVNVGLSDNAALRVSGFYNRQDGAIANAFNSFHINDHRDYGLRGKLLWWPVEDFSVLLIGEHQYSYRQQGTIIRSFGTDPVYRSYFSGISDLPSAKNFIAYNEAPWFAKTKIDAGSAELNYSMGDYTLTSISAYRRLKLDQTADLDNAPVNYFSFNQALNKSRQITQEVRLASPSGSALEYVVGAYYYDTKVEADETGYGTFGLPLGLLSNSGGTNNYRIATKSAALFGQGTLRIADGFKIIGGLRYTHDKVDASIGLTRLAFVRPLALTVPSEGGIKKDNLSGRLGLQYEITPELMTYATYARGYKGPSIDLIQGRARDVLPEKVNSYEAGFKSVLFDRRVTLNIAAYWTEFLDFQAQSYDYDFRPVTITIVNAGKLRSRGLEGDLSFRLSRVLSVSAYGSYNDARFLDFQGACYSGQPLSTVVGQGCYVDPSTNVRVANFAGKRLTNAPKWSYGIQGAYDQPIAGDFQLSASANWSWRSSAFNAVADPLAKTEPYGLLNGTVGIGSQDRQWTLSIYTRNLFNKHFAAVTQNFFDTNGLAQVLAADAFRTVGVALDLHF